MALLLMEFLSGLEGDHYQEVEGGRVTRWFDLNGTEIELPLNEGRGVSYRLRDDAPTIPQWYIDLTTPENTEPPPSEETPPG